GASIVRSRPDNEMFPGYADLYQRARSILEGRVTELACGNGCQLHTRIVGHTWFRHGATNLVRAAITFGVICLNESELPRYGVGEPTYQELAASGGMTREQLIASGTTQRLDKIYTDTDIRDESDTTSVFLFSYGEYVETIEGINYGPFIKRAEAL